MTYSLLPHNSDFSSDNVVKPAYELNIPTVAVAGAAKNTDAFLTIDASDVICEAVKPAELIENAYVLRMYECERNAVNATVTLHTPFKKVWLTNMLEDKKEEIAVNGNSFVLPFKPFEIVTVLVEK